MTLPQTLFTVALLMAGTVITRFLPFWVLRKDKPLPPLVLYLGKVLPTAVMGLLVVYCLKDVSFAALPHWLPAACGVVVCAVLHYWKENTLLSLLASTAVYAVLLQLLS